MPSVLQAASSDPEHLARRYDGDIGMYNKMRNRISGRGGQRADRNADGRRAVVDSGELGTRPRSVRTRSWMLPIMTWRASPRAAVLQAPSRRPARAGRWETASRRAGRVGLFPLVLSGAFYTCVGSQGGPDCACASGAPPHDLAVSPASPCKVSGARYRGSDIGTSLPTQLLE